MALGRAMSMCPIDCECSCDVTGYSVVVVCEVDAVMSDVSNVSDREVLSDCVLTVPCGVKCASEIHGPLADVIPDLA